jgi:solute carrier family 25 carnitine/acylcarnitine transporter 20/29
MLKTEGTSSFYKGAAAPLLGNMVLLGIHFPTFMKNRAYLEQGDAPGAFTPWKILAAGAAAGALGSVVSTPTEHIRTKMQMVRKNNILAQMKGAAAGRMNPEENYKVCLHRLAVMLCMPCKNLSSCSQHGNSSWLLSLLPAVEF